MTDKQRAAKVLELLAERYPDLETHLMAESPWELLVATVLAAQCTDKRVNQVTPELFRRWPDPAALAQATIPSSRKSSTPSGSITARRNTSSPPRSSS